MKTILKWKELSQSLFIRLLASFTLIIVLLTSFNFFSFTFFRDQIHEEIITYNKLNLKQTADSFETHLQLAGNMVLGFYLSDRVQILNKNNTAYDIASQVRTDIQNMVSNPLLYMENLVLYFEESQWILEKDGSSTADKMFTKFYVSKDYPHEFWKQQFANSSYMRVYPATEFREETFTNTYTTKGRLFPMLVQNKLYPGLSMIAFLDADRTVRAFHRSINENFLLLDRQGMVLYSSLREPLGKLPELSSAEGYVQSGENYFFYHTGSFTGMTYVNIIPTKEVNAKISRLNLTLLTVLFAAIAIAIGTSVLFSMRINNPVKNIVRSIRQWNDGSADGVGQDEFEQIRSTIDNMLRKNKDIDQVLTEKNSLLKHYAYMNKVKNIHDSFDDFKELTQQDRPYRFVLFQFFFTDRFHEDSEVGKTRATYFLREIIRQYMSTNYAEAHTLQVEKDQILTIIFSGPGEASVHEVLESLKNVLEHDKELCYLTIALSPMYEKASQFTEAYETVLRLAEARTLNMDLQLIEQAPSSVEPPALTASQEQELEVNLRAGNESVVIPLMKRIVTSAYRKGTPAELMKRFAEEWIDRTVKTLVLLQIDYKTGGFFQDMRRKVPTLQSIEQLESLLSQVLDTACRLIQTRGGQRDPMTTFVLDYLDTHYREDITLDSVAEKLDISGGYLSTYFKEKTGKNFIDYVHEVRINKAKELLLRSEQKIQDTASEVGYNNLNSFNRMFKKYTGMTPTEFRRNTP